MHLFKDFWKFCFKIPRNKYDKKIWGVANKWFWVSLTAFFVWLTSLQLPLMIQFVRLFK